MFLKNKYTKWYFSIIEKANFEKRIKTKTTYYEKHHIIPKCKPFNGDNSTDNLVLLTPKEHFICHLLLTKMNEGIRKYKMIWALHRLSYGNSNLRENYTARTYDLVRKLHSENMKGLHRTEKEKEDFSLIRKKAAIKQWENEERRISLSLKRSKYIEENYESVVCHARKVAHLGASEIKRKWAEEEEWAKEQRQKCSERSKGSKNSMFGKKLSEEHIRKLSKATSNKRWMNKDGKNSYVNLELVEEYLKEEYKFGKLQKKRERSVVE